MKSDSEEKPLTTEDLITMYEGLQKEYSNLAREFGNERAGRQIWKYFALAILAVCIINTKHSSYVWVPDPKDRQMRVEQSDWWGIERHTFYPVWRNPSGEDYES